MATKTAPPKRSAAKSTDAPKKEAPRKRVASEGNAPSGTRTLTRGLDVIDVVSQGNTALQDLATELGLPRSTAHRLASALVERRYLKFIRGAGYSLGPRLLELGLVDKVVREPLGGAHRNPRSMAVRLKAVLLNQLDQLQAMPTTDLLEQRYQRLRGYGAFQE